MFLASLSTVIFFFTLNACTVKRAPVETGTIPKLAAPSPADEEFGKALFAELRIDYKLDSDNQKHDRLTQIFNKLAQAAGVDHLPWHLYLLNGPEIVDVRAVHGNYIFVWSGFLDAVDNEYELAGILMRPSETLLNAMSCGLGTGIGSRRIA